MNRTKKQTFLDMSVTKAKKSPGVGQYDVAKAWEKSAKLRKGFNTRGARR